MENKDYSVWTNFYQEFANKLREYKTDRAILIEKIKNVFNEIGMELPTLEKNNKVFDICPFTVFGLFNKGISDSNRIKIIEGFKKEFKVDAEVPTNFNGVPILNNLRAAFYSFGSVRVKDDIDNLWDVFINALNYADNKTNENKEKLTTSWNIVIKQKGIRWNITMGVYLIRPYDFISLDEKTRTYISLEEFMPKKYIDEIGKINDIMPCEKYLKIIELTKEVLDSDNSKISNFVELSYEAWLYGQSKEKKSLETTNEQLPRYDENNWRPTKEEYDPGLTKEDWLRLLNDKKIFDTNSIIVMKSILDYGGIASCKELSDKYGKTSGFYNIVVSKLAHRILDKTSIKRPDPNVPYSKYWPVLFFAQKSLTNKYYLYKLRGELKEALLEFDLSKIKIYEKNFKSDERNYFWLNTNPKIFSFNNLKTGEAVEFTLNNDNGNPRRKHECFIKAKKGDFVIDYETSPSKRIVALCEVSRESNGESIEIKKTASLKKEITLSEIQQYEELKELEVLRQTTLFDLTKEQYDILMILIEEEENENEKIEFEKYTKEDFLKDVFITSEEYDKLYSLIKHKHNIILQGAPGVGKTFLSKRFAYSILGEKKNTNIAMVQFHQNYTYEDFVMGYKPIENGFKLKTGSFYNFVELAKTNPNEDFFFIIDEINRGNLSKIFGELLMLIEHDYRNTSIKLSYNEEEFYVPQNLYIIGMMNTADRSLSLIDYALRRRFSFVNLSPAFDNDTFKEYQKEVDNRSFDNLIKVVKSLNEEITSRLGKCFVIGHSYFVNSDPSEITNSYLKQVVEFDLLPLLEEYFFDETDDIISKWTKKLYEALDEEE